MFEKELCGFFYDLRGLDSLQDVVLEYLLCYLLFIR